MKLHIDPYLFGDRVKYVASRTPAGPATEVEGRVLVVYLAHDHEFNRDAPRVAVRSADGFIDDLWMTAVSFKGLADGRIPHDRDDHGIPIR